MLLIELYQEQRNSTFTHDGKRYNLNKLLKLVDDTAVEQFKVSQLKWILGYTDVDSNRVNKADISRPILVIKWNNKLVVLDGAHRLSKAVQRSKTEISGKLVTNDQLRAAKK